MLSGAWWDIDLHISKMAVEGNFSSLPILNKIVKILFEVGYESIHGSCCFLPKVERRWIT